MSVMARPVPPVLRSAYGLVVSTDCQWFLALVYSSLVEIDVVRGYTLLRYVTTSGE